MMVDKTIVGDKIYLTPITYDDCEDFIRWRNSEFIKSYFIYRNDITLEEQKSWIREKVETGCVVQYIIWENSTRKKIGCVYLQSIDRVKNTAEFGILIGEQDCVGKGYGKESTRLIISYAFEKLGLDSVYLRALKGNVRAIKSYEAVGFKMKGKSEFIMIDGQNTEIVFMSIDKEEVTY